MFVDPEILSVPQKVADPVASRVSPGDEDGAGAEASDLLDRPAQIEVRSAGLARDRRGLVEVRRHEVAQGKEIPSQCAKPRGGEERSAACRDEHWVEDDVLRPVTAEAGSDCADVPRVPQHPDFHRGGSEIGEDRIDLFRDEARRERLDRDDASSVLRGSRDDHRRAVYGVRREGQQVRLDPGASARIGPRDRENTDRANGSRIPH